MSTIQPKIHSFAQALACKRNNETLSTRTLKKLTLIANAQFGGNAERVFGRPAPGAPRFDGDAAGLRNAISSQLANVRSASLQQVMSQWLERLPVKIPHVVEIQSQPFSAPAQHEKVLLNPPGASGTGRQPMDPAIRAPTVVTWVENQNRLLAEASGKVFVSAAPPDPKTDYWDEQSVSGAGTASPRDGRHVHFSAPGPDKETAGKMKPRYEPDVPRESGEAKARRLLEQFREEGTSAGFSPSEQRAFWDAAINVPESSARAAEAVMRVATEQEFLKGTGPLPSMKVLAKVLDGR